ncbi:uncharacterized protein LOC115999383 [Ipomoea triloba]|uniref:uncharacterized protein LOC115999383 n=1 Tax=Ipomoea triloba TaxID=35885 RepID=UPI00125CD91D|nr:uncharacterized protein LOC115999383 [Ipomoea triloba]
MSDDKRTRNLRNNPNEGSSEDEATRKSETNDRRWFFVFKWIEATMAIWAKEVVVSWNGPRSKKIIPGLLQNINRKEEEIKRLNARIEEAANEDSKCNGKFVLVVVVNVICSNWLYKTIPAAGVELSPFTAWSRLWKSRFPPKVLNFIWRCARAILPTRTILLGHGVMIDVECPLCHSHPETPLHLFRQCIHTSAFWDNILDVPVPVQDECFEGWLSWIFEIKDAHVILYCVALFWSIWLCRNDVVWNHKQWIPGDVTRLASRLVHEWNSLGVNGAETIAVAPMQFDQSMLSSNTITIHVDAAVFPDRDDGFVAVVAHEGGSRSVAAMNGSVRCLQNPILAEALAIKEALSWAKNNGWERLVLYSDCQLVCQMLEGSSMIYSYVGCVLRDCLALKRLFVEISFHFVSRSANTLAHALARAAASQSGPRSWFFTIPDCIQHLILSY